jgi:hypothetical protein
VGFFSQELDRLEREIERERRNDAMRLDEGLRMLYADEKLPVVRPFNPNKIRQKRKFPRTAQ